ncbi:MAG: DUF2330 domain-containing protein [Nannocystaceae bacterium]|nr:DUF2330 domain-containing protein [bacterium]
MPRPYWIASMAAPALVLFAHLMAPATAAACGGTFCDGGQGGMPVDQTGETIVFAQGGGFVEAHVQINYDGGDASQFSWIVPVPAVPEIEVGSLDFIDQLRSATVPSFGITSGTNECIAQPTETGISSGFITDPDGGGVSVDPDPEVVELSTAGAFEYVILQGGTSTTMMQWLEDNGYAPSPIAPAIFDAYIDEGSVFVAFRLNHLAGIEDLHPVVIRYAGTEPCIPLRLTAVAARDDMDIRALFLGEERVLPTNYRHVRLNQLRLQWLQSASNYATVVSRALDEAGGRAFVTEYAGDSDIVDPTPLDATGFDATDFEGVDPLSVVAVLQQQGLVQCTDSCGYTHELVPLLLREFLPAPDGIDPDVLYACLSCYEDVLSLDAWDEDAFIARYREYISDPMDHAADLLQTWPYLTRLYTRMSPSEMAFDPMFAEVPGLSVVPNIWGAQRNTDPCCEDRVVLPDGATVRLGATGAWPGWSNDMPYAAVVQQYQPDAPPANEVDNLSTINGELAAHNAAVRSDCGGTGTGGDTGADPDSGPSSSGSGGSGGPTASGGDTTSGGAGSTSSSGNAGGLDDDGGCRTGGRASDWLALLVGLGLAGLRRRRG